MAKAYNTINTKLLYKESGEGSYSQLIKIKSYPDLGGTPEMIETTDLEDEITTKVIGVQSIDDMEFKANYTLEDFKKVKALEGKSLDFKLTFKNHTQVTWSGELTVFVNGGEVNGVQEMSITIAPSTKPVVAAYED